MSPHEDPHLSYAQDIWFNWFRDGILNSDIDVSGETPIMHYLIDLNILEYDVNGLLKISSIKKEHSGHEVKSRLLVVLSDLSSTENGFALVYLLSCFSNKKLPSLITESDASSNKRKNIFNKNYLPGDKKLRPFLDVEQKTIVRLRGEVTSQEDAQWLFSYILNKTRKKSPAKKWEQISRKRHR